jgi:Na+/H+ antiporter NhaC
MILPTLVVIVLSFLHVNIFVSLFSGIVLAVLIGTTMGLFGLSDLICLEGNNERYRGCRCRLSVCWIGSR